MSGEAGKQTGHYASHGAGAEWGTPPEIVDPLADSLVQGEFDLDPASGAEPKPYARQRYTVEDDGLAHEWSGHVWLNPPYGREHNPRWGEKTLQEWRAGNVKSVTVLIPASTETDWFQKFYAKADMLTFLDERVKFIGAGDKDASFPSVIATFGLVNLPRDYVGALREKGATYPKTEEILHQLVAVGHTPTQAFDYYFTEVSNYKQTDWADVRGVPQSSVSRNAKNITSCYTLRGNFHE